MKNYYRPKFDEEVIKEIIAYLKDQGIDVWFDQGSLLGLVRDGKFIEWDTDVDLGALDISLEKKLAIAHYFYKRYGSAFYSKANNAIKVGFLDVISGESWLVDLVFYTKRKSKLEKFWVVNRARLSLRLGLYLAEVFGGSRARSRKPHVRWITLTLHVLYSQKIAIWLYDRLEAYIDYVKVHANKDYFFPLQQSYLYGAAIPGQAEQYLLMKYGSNWRVPTKNWDYVTEDGGVSRHR